MSILSFLKGLFSSKPAAEAVAVEVKKVEEPVKVISKKLAEVAEKKVSVKEIKAKKTPAETVEPTVAVEGEKKPKPRRRRKPKPKNDEGSQE